MALTSPGVEVTIIDQSQYLPAGSNSVPLVLLATAQNKSNAAGTGIAVGTTPANANTLYRVTSQRDLVTLFGVPFFYKTTNGTPIQGYELNEYGLLTAYSVLGGTNLIYVLRADIDLASLIGQIARPTGNPTDGTYWLDALTSSWGIFEFNASTGNFTNQVPIVIESASDLDSTNDYAPKDYVGNIGDYAIVPFDPTNGTGDPLSHATYWYKAGRYNATTNPIYNSWVKVGGPQWRLAIPVLQGGALASSPAAGTLTIALTSTSATPFTATINPSPQTAVGLATAINTLAVANGPIRGITAEVVNGRVNIFQSSVLPSDGSIFLQDGGATWAQYGFSGVTPSTGTTFPRAGFVYGTNAQQPNWRTTPAFPTGSVWIKTNAPNNGTNIVMSRYSSATDAFSGVSVPLYSTDSIATNTLDSAGGKNIAVGSLYTQFQFGGFTAASLQYFRRAASGPAVYVGTVSASSPSAAIFGPYTTGITIGVRVSEPGSSALSNIYNFTFPASVTAASMQDFVTYWNAAQIPYTTCTISATNNIVLTHTEGGEIIIDDYGFNNTPLDQAGLGFSSGPAAAKRGGSSVIQITPTRVGAAMTTTTTGSGTGLILNTIEYQGTSTTSTAITFVNPGTGYQPGDRVSVASGVTGFSQFVYPGDTLTFVVTAVTGGVVTGLQQYSGRFNPIYNTMLSNWQEFDYQVNDVAPSTLPANNTNWYYSVVDQVDIMVNSGSTWVGYRNATYGTNGIFSATGSGTTDPNGPIVSSSQPTLQSDGTALVQGDLWIDTSDLENYPVIKRWAIISGLGQWVLIDNKDQTTEAGVVFADARWAANGGVDPVDDPIPTIQGMLTSNYVDLDVPSATLYPRGTLLFNTRRSGYNVKQFRTNYFTQGNYPNAGAYNPSSPATIGNLPAVSYTWVSVSGNKTDGSPYMGRKAQRVMVVNAMKAAVDTNQQVREEDTFFNLMAAPNYCELQPNMITLNNDRNQTAYIVGDTPLRLADDANAIVNWATNASGASATGEDGLVTRNTYMGLYYPSGISTDLSGAQVVVPPSHMILRTILYNDTVAYPWLAPAGQRRGIVDNATNIGYIDAATGEFITTKNRMALRDVEYQNFINPIAFFTNIGLLNYGNKNSFDSQSALDRTNVARLICYIRERLQVAVRPFIFEPNDTITRNEAKGVVQTLLADILTKRGIYDYLVVCDESNNTPARIDRNELWIDVAIEPVKAVEFIYIPVRILNTGEIAGL